MHKMMRQYYREGSPIATDLPMKRTNEMINGLKSNKNNAIVPQAPRSPITKAFEFFAWYRNKKHVDKIEKAEKKSNEIEHQYQKNVYKNGSTIRDILSDKSNKKSLKSNGIPLQRHNTLSGFNRKKKNIIRNSSLDNGELAMQADDDFDSTNLSQSWNDRGSYLTNAMTSDDEKDGCENICPKQINSSKHIIFNDENIVYLIKKEKPVNTKDNEQRVKEKSRNIQRQRAIEENNNNNINNNNSIPDNSGTVIKARLKLAKVASQDESSKPSQQCLQVPQNGPMQNGNNLAKPSILCRQNSFTKQLSVDTIEMPRRSPEPSSEGSQSDSQRNKPRKKLSFREPVESSRLNEIQQNLQLSKMQRQSYPNRQLPSYDSELESQAMLIVRTVGQAFEVCHNSPDGQSSDVIDHDLASDQFSEDELQKKDPLPSTPDLPPLQRPNHLDLIIPPPMNDVNNKSNHNNNNNNNNGNRKSPGSEGDRSPPSPMSSTKEVQQLRELLEQQALQTRQTVAQLTMVKEQLISETKARIEAQLRTKHLLQQNRELLEQLVSLGGYTEPNQSGLTSANIALAPQSSLQMFLQDQSELSSPIRKAFLAATANNNNLPSITQHLNNLGSINQQLSTLTNQLSGLNQQSQNLQNLQNYNHSLQNLSLQNANTFPTMNQIQNLNNNNNNLTGGSAANQEAIMQNDLYQMNQELLKRLENLNFGANGCTTSNGNNNSGNGGGTGSSAVNQNINNNSSQQNSFIFANPTHLPNNGQNNNFNFLNTPNSMSSLTSSPLGTLNRNSFLSSPLEDNIRLSIDKNLNSIEDNGSQFIKPLSQVGTLTTIDHDGNVKVIVPVSAANGYSNTNNAYGESSANHRQNDRKTNVVMLKVTDEAGNVTNTRKLSATPSFITRSTSEKVPNRSQMMSEVQRTAWARHTTK